MSNLFQTGSNAIISLCGKYRYRLERDLGGDGPTAAIIMVNPSTADHTVDDQTIRKLIGFGRRFGWGKIIVGNKFAFRATDVKQLKFQADPIGPENDRHLEEILLAAQVHVVAWGNLTKLPKPLRGRYKQILELAEKHRIWLRCFGMALDGDPLHPLTIGYDRELVRWQFK